jgi:SAM-dependent methyltransferase
MGSCYDKSFYQKGSETAISSATEIVPLVMHLAAPQSVVDVGCGAGEWLSIFRSAGIKDILGIDGQWVPQEQLHIPATNFLSHDLGRIPLNIKRCFDLAVSMEVGEHLPASDAKRYVSELVGLAPIVLFSAAVPFQGGVQHVNEQWPQYWVQLFHDHQYFCIDCIRGRVWSNNNVAFWYAQNCFIAVNKACMYRFPRLVAEYERVGDGVPALVHPLNYLVKVRQKMVSPAPS